MLSSLELYVDVFKLFNKETFLLNTRDVFIFVGLKKGKVMCANVNIVTFYFNCLISPRGHSLNS